MPTPEVVIPVVDKQDKIIGYKTYAQLKAGDIWRIASVWITNSQGQSLIAQRHSTKTVNPNKWGPAASGTVEKGETYLENAYKELEEEVGVANVKLVPVSKHFYHEQDGDTYRWCRTYRLYVDWPIEKFVMQEEEVQDIRWIDTHDLIEDFTKHPEKYATNANPKMYSLR